MGQIKAKTKRLEEDAAERREDLKEVEEFALR